jgi:hypothetical protein
MAAIEGKYSYECLCKAVSYEVTGALAMACLCHCESCRVYGSGAGNVMAVKLEQVAYTKGARQPHRI